MTIVEWQTQRKAEYDQWFYDFCERNDRRPQHKDYLASAIWQRRRQEILDTRGRYCCECGSKYGKLDVHHESYEHVGYELNSELAVLCNKCHQKKHPKGLA